MNVVPMPDKPGKKARNLPAPAYVPNAEEQKMLTAFNERFYARPPMPALKGEMVDGKFNIDIDHPDHTTAVKLLCEAVGTPDAQFLAGILHDASHMIQKSGPAEIGPVNQVLAIITGIAPADPVESLLATQMAAIHMATIRSANLLSRATDMERLQSHERSLNRLARTFTAQVEALKRHRSKGEQRVYVERVNVEPGGQAIVGNVGHGGRGQNENPA